MINVQMIMVALEKYNSYMYYAYSSDSLRSQDAKNLCEYIETTLQTLVFTDPEDKKALEIAQYISKLLNEALTYAYRLNYALCRAKTFEQGKIVYNLIGKITDLTFIPNFYTDGGKSCVSNK